ncbi:MAG TPA: LysM peptidoglycan-binding domain-containing protein [Thermoflexia bacterium]|nr:LysM peptidoglycan-binding domain-containing protein [Thermoflexia bacterium]
MNGWRLDWACCLFLLTACASGGPEITSSPTGEPQVAELVVPVFAPPPTILAPVTLVVTPAVEEASLSRQHVVQAGDTLLALAMQYDVPLAAIQQANGMGASSMVPAGAVLEIPAAAAWRGAAPFWVLYEVVAGDTLGEIAQRYELQLTELQTVNGLGDAATIHVGQLLILPLRGPAVAQAPASPATPLPPTAAPATATVPAPTPAVSPQEPTPPPAIPPPASPVAPPADVAAWPAEAARLINEVRAVHGLPPFSYHLTLASAAQLHANDCAQRGWCSHTGSDGVYIQERLRRAGYAGAGWAECWAQSQSPQGAVDRWMDEVPPNDPHRRTLLSDWLTEIGLGASDAGRGYYYFIADFGRP